MGSSGCLTEGPMDLVYQIRDRRPPVVTGGGTHVPWKWGEGVPINTMGRICVDGITRTLAEANLW